MGLTAISGVAGSLLTKIESLEHRKHAPATSSQSQPDVSTSSSPANLFSGLETLSTQNAGRFQSITAGIAQKLQTAAKGAADPSQANALNQLAANFQNASQSGKFADLFAQTSQLTGLTSHLYSDPTAAASTQATLANIFSQASAVI